MKRYFYVKLLALGCVVSFFMTSCFKDKNLLDVNDVVMDSEWVIATPVVNSRLTLENLLKDPLSLVRYGEDGLVSVVYDLPDTSISLSSILSIPPQTLLHFNVDNLIIPGASVFDILQKDTVMFQYTDSITFSFTQGEADADNPIRIDSARLKNLSFVISGSSNIPTNIDIRIQSQNITNNNQALDQTVTITSAGTNFNNVIDLSNCLLKLMNNSIIPDRNNPPYLQYSITISVHKPSSSYQGQTDGNIALDMSMQSTGAQTTAIDIDACWGYFGNFALNFNSSVDMAFFDKDIDVLKVDSAKLSFAISNNGIGVPVRINNCQVIFTKGGIPTGNTLNILPPNIDLTAPSFNRSADTTIVNGISNIIDINKPAGISAPDAVSYNFAASSNPEDDPATPNFLKSDAKIKVGAQVEIPLSFRVGNLILADTIEFQEISMPSNKITDAPDSALLKSNFLNGFPFDVLVSSYLMDSNYNIIYTVFENINLKPGQVDAKGKVVSPASIRNVDVSILKSGLDCLKRTKYIYVTGRLNTTNYQNQSIKIYRDDDKQGFLDVGMGIRINARIK